MGVEIRLGSMRFTVNARGAATARRLAKELLWNEVVDTDEVLTGFMAEGFVRPRDEGGDDDRVGEWEVEVTRAGYADEGGRNMRARSGSRTSPSCRRHPLTVPTPARPGWTGRV